MVKCYDIPMGMADFASRDPIGYCRLFVHRDDIDPADSARAAYDPFAFVNDLLAKANIVPNSSPLPTVVENHPDVGGPVRVVDAEAGGGHPGDGAAEQGGGRPGDGAEVPGGGRPYGGAAEHGGGRHGDRAALAGGRADEREADAGGIGQPQNQHHDLPPDAAQATSIFRGDFADFQGQATAAEEVAWRHEAPSEVDVMAKQAKSFINGMRVTIGDIVDPKPGGFRRSCGLADEEDDAGDVSLDLRLDEEPAGGPAALPQALQQEEQAAAAVSLVNEAVPPMPPLRGTVQHYLQQPRASYEYAAPLPALDFSGFARALAPFVHRNELQPQQQSFFLPNHPQQQPSHQPLFLHNPAVFQPNSHYGGYGMSYMPGQHPHPQTLVPQQNFMPVPTLPAASSATTEPAVHPPPHPPQTQWQRQPPPKQQQLVANPRQAEHPQQPEHPHQPKQPPEQPLPPQQPPEQPLPPQQPPEQSLPPQQPPQQPPPQPPKAPQPGSLQHILLQKQEEDCRRMQDQNNKPPAKRSKGKQHAQQIEDVNARKGTRRRQRERFDELEKHKAAKSTSNSASDKGEPDKKKKKRTKPPSQASSSCSSQDECREDERPASSSRSRRHSARSPSSTSRRSAPSPSSRSRPSARSPSPPPSPASPASTTTKKPASQQSVNFKVNFHTWDGDNERWVLYRMTYAINVPAGIKDISAGFSDAVKELVEAGTAPPSFETGDEFLLMASLNPPSQQQMSPGWLVGQAKSGRVRPAISYRDFVLYSAAEDAKSLVQTEKRKAERKRKEDYAARKRDVESPDPSEPRKKLAKIAGDHGQRGSGTSDDEDDAADLAEKLESAYDALEKLSDAVVAAKSCIMCKSLINVHKAAIGCQGCLQHLHICRVCLLLHCMWGVPKIILWDMDYRRDFPEQLRLLELWDLTKDGASKLFQDILKLDIYFIQRLGGQLKWPEDQKVLFKCGNCKKGLGNVGFALLPPSEKLLATVNDVVRLHTSNKVFKKVNGRTVAFRLAKRDMSWLCWFNDFEKIGGSSLTRPPTAREFMDDPAGAADVTNSFLKFLESAVKKEIKAVLSAKYSTTPLEDTLLPVLATWKARKTSYESLDILPSESPPPQRHSGPPATVGGPRATADVAPPGSKSAYDAFSQQQDSLRDKEAKAKKAKEAAAAARTLAEKTKSPPKSKTPSQAPGKENEILSPPKLRDRGLKLSAGSKQSGEATAATTKQTPILSTGCKADVTGCKTGSKSAAGKGGSKGRGKHVSGEAAAAQTKQTPIHSANTGKADSKSAAGKGRGKHVTGHTGDGKANAEGTGGVKETVTGGSNDIVKDDDNPKLPDISKPPSLESLDEESEGELTVINVVID